MWKHSKQLKAFVCILGRGIVHHHSTFYFRVLFRLYKNVCDTTSEDRSDSDAHGIVIVVLPHSIFHLMC